MVQNGKEVVAFDCLKKLGKRISRQVSAAVNYFPGRK